MHPESQKYPVAECPKCHDVSGNYMAGYCDACDYHRYSAKCPCHKCKGNRNGR